MNLETTLKIFRAFKIVCFLVFIIAVNKFNIIAQSSVSSLQEYINNEAYFIKDIDINNDGFNDKVVSHNRNEGDELLLFLNENNTYKLVLEAINFSEDGGKVLRDISAVPNSKTLVFKLETYFPKGTDETDYLISYKDNEWILDKTVHRLITWQNDYTKLYTCTLVQNLALKAFSSSSETVMGFKTLPENWETNDCCTVSYYFEDKLSDFLIRIKKEDFWTCGEIERYKQLIEKFRITNNNIGLYIEIITELKKKELLNEEVYLEEQVTTFLLGKP